VYWPGARAGIQLFTIGGVHAPSVRIDLRTLGVANQDLGEPAVEALVKPEVNRAGGRPKIGVGRQIGLDQMRVRVYLPRYGKDGYQSDGEQSQQAARGHWHISQTRRGREPSRPPRRCYFVMVKVKYPPALWPSSAEIVNHRIP